jgi:hypothetical protein
MAQVQMAEVDLVARRISLQYDTYGYVTEGHYHHLYQERRSFELMGSGIDNARGW